MISIFRVRTEVQGNIKRFNSIVNNSEVTFKVVSSDNNVVSVLNSYWNGSYEVTDMNIEQGRRFVIEVNVGAFVFPNSTNIQEIRNNLKCVCEISNKCFDVVECKIIENPI
jgi:hypothetical protein